MLRKVKKYEGNYPVVGNSTFGRLAITPEVLSKMMKATYIVFPEIRYLKFSEEYKSSKPVISASSSSMGNYEWEREPIIRMDMVGYIRAVEVGPLKEVKTFNITVTKSDIKPKFGSIDKVKMISDSIRDLRFRIRNFLNIRAVGFVSRVSKGKYIVNVGRNFYLSTGNEFLVFEGKVYSSKDSFSTNLVYKGVAKIWAVGNNYSEIIPSSPNFNIEAGDIVVEFRNNGISLGGYLGVQYTTYRPVSNVTLQNYFNEKWGLSERFVPVVGIWGDTETYTPWIDLIVNVYFAFYKPLLIGVSFYTGLPVYPGGFKVKPYVGFDLVVYSDQLLDYPGMEGTLISPSVGSIDLVGGLSFEYRFLSFMSFSVDASYAYPILYPFQDLWPIILKEGFSFNFVLQLKL